MNHSGHGQSSSTGTLQVGGEGAGLQESEPEKDHLPGPMKTGWDPQTHVYGDVSGTGGELWVSPGSKGGQPEPWGVEGGPGVPEGARANLSVL